MFHASTDGGVQYIVCAASYCLKKSTLVFCTCTDPFSFFSTMQSVHTKYGEKMEFPSNGISIVGCLRPAFVDEESYLRRLFHHENGDGYSSDWRGTYFPIARISVSVKFQISRMCLHFLFLFSEWFVLKPHCGTENADESEKEEEQVAGTFDLVGD